MADSILYHPIEPGSTDDGKSMNMIVSVIPTLTDPDRSGYAEYFDKDMCYAFHSKEYSLAPYTKFLTAKINIDPIRINWITNSYNTSSYYIRAVMGAYGLGSKYGTTYIGSINGQQCPLTSLSFPAYSKDLNTLVEAQSLRFDFCLCLATTSHDAYRQIDCTGIFSVSTFNMSVNITFA